jgi:hypothetical protein
MSDQLIDTVLIIKRALYRERQQKLLLLFLILFTATLLLYFAFLQKETTLYQLLVITSLVAYISALLFLRDVLRFWNLESSPLLQIIIQAPKNIVWIYQFHVHISPFGIKFRKEISFCFRLMNRDTLQIRIPEKESVILMENLEKSLDHCSFGYSKEKEQLYGIHPELLIKD